MNWKDRVTDAEIIEQAEAYLESARHLLQVYFEYTAEEAEQVVAQYVEDNITTNPDAELGDLVCWLLFHDGIWRLVLRIHWLAMGNTEPSFIFYKNNPRPDDLHHHVEAPVY